MLIIASDNLAIYKEEEKIWRSYMHSCPEHVEAYFIRGNPKLKRSSIVVDDIIWSQTKENVLPGILNKTILSLQHFLPRLQDKFDFVVRTNLSSFYVLPRLIAFARTLPRKNCYRGPVHSSKTLCGGLDWAAGYGMIISSDLAYKMAKTDFLINYNIGVQDDLVIALFLRNHYGITPVSHSHINIHDIFLRVDELTL